MGRYRVDPFLGQLEAVDLLMGTYIPGGTAGSVLFVGSSKSLAQDNANLFWDDSNNRLGVGTNSPSDTLSVAGTTFIDQDLNELSLQIDSEATTVDVFDIIAPQTTTGIVIDVENAGSLTTGKIVRFRSNSADTSPRDLVIINQEHADASETTVLNLKQDADKRTLFIDVNGNGQAIVISSQATTKDVIEFLSPATTTGDVIGIGNAGSLTTGTILRLRSNSADTSTRNLILMVNEHVDAVGATVCQMRQDAAIRNLFLDTNGNAASLLVDSEATTANTIDIGDPKQTTGNVISITGADGLTDGSILNLVSDSSDTSVRPLVDIVNDNSLATGAVNLRLQQDSTGDILQCFDGATQAMTVDDEGNILLANALFIQFRDSALNINSAADGHLDINADVSIDLNAPSVIHTSVTKEKDAIYMAIAANTLIVTVNGFAVLGLDDTASDEWVEFGFHVPLDFEVSSTATFKWRWFNVSLQSGTNSVVWDFTWNNHLISGTLGTANTSTATDALAEDQAANTVIESSLSLTGLAAGEYVTVRVLRDGANGSDTVTGDVDVFDSSTFEYTSDKIY